MYKKLGLFLFGLLVSTTLLGQVPVSGLPQATLPLTGNESVVMNQNGTTKQGKVSSITSLVNLSAATGITLTPNPIVGGSGTIGLNLPVLASWGGTGELGVITGIPKANGAGAFTTASSSDVPIPGANTQVLFNNSGVLGANSNFTYSSGLDVLSLGSSLIPGTFAVGALDAMTISGVALTTPAFAMNSNTQGNLELHSYTSTAASGAFAYGARSRGSITTPTAVSNGDNLLTLAGAGFDGTNYTWGAHIHFLVDGTPSAGVLPGAIDFQTTPSASNTPVSRLLLDHSGAYNVNGSAGTAGNFLRSAGTGAAAGWSTDTIPNTVTLGDIWYGSATNVLSALAGNTTTTQLFLSQTGTGTVSAAPAWSSLPGSFSGFANPSGSIGLAAVNGVATTAMRSDATPPLSQAIAPTWTGAHTFSQAQGATRFTLSGPNTGVGWNAVFTDTTNSVSRGFIGIGTTTVGGAAVTDFAISPGASGSVVIGTANGGAIGTRFGSTGNVTINTPGSGTALSVNALSGGVAASFLGPTSGSGFNVNFFDSTNSAFRGFIGVGTTTVGGAAVTDFAISPGASGSVVIGTANGGAIGTRFGPSGNVTINAPTSGATLALNFVSGTNGLTIADGTVSAVMGTGGGQLNIGTTNATAMALATNGSTRVTIGSPGNVSIAAPTSGNALTLAGLANAYTETINGNSTTGQSFGLVLNAGTNSSDEPLLIRNQTGSVNYFQILGDGGVAVGTPTGGDKGLGTVNAQALYVQGQPIDPVVVFGSCSAGGCTALRASGASTTITRTSAGVYGVTFSATFAQQPACTITPDTTAGFASTASLSTTVVTVKTFIVNAGSAVATDMSWNMICF